mgnify:CR=1 FL=1
MELGIIGLGRMGANMTERLVLGGASADQFRRLRRRFRKAGGQSKMRLKACRYRR